MFALSKVVDLKYKYKEVNCIEPSLSVRIPYLSPILFWWSVTAFGTVFLLDQMIQLFLQNEYLAKSLSTTFNIAIQNTFYVTTKSVYIVKWANSDI
jgi:hypothetical protein